MGAVYHIGEVYLVVYSPGLEIGVRVGVGDVLEALCDQGLGGGQGLDLVDSVVFGLGEEGDGLVVGGEERGYLGVEGGLHWIRGGRSSFYYYWVVRIGYLNGGINRYRVGMEWVGEGERGSGDKGVGWCVGWSGWRGGGTGWGMEKIRFRDGIV